jgi:hypothetical protein
MFFIFVAGNDSTIEENVRHVDFEVRETTRNVHNFFFVRIKILYARRIFVVYYTEVMGICVV